MGEYAIRKQDGERIKIGTCESMYYLRYEDRERVAKLSGNVDPANETGLFWRLPFPDEDNVQAGNYNPFDRGLRLYRTVKSEFPNRQDTCEGFSDPSTIEDPGTMQFHNDSGILLNVKCFHGEKLPEAGPDIECHWNGRSWFYELAFIKNHEEGKVYPVVRCRHCRNMWRYTWKQILPFIGDEEMRKRLNVYNK